MKIYWTHKSIPELNLCGSVSGVGGARINRLSGTGRPGVVSFSAESSLAQERTLVAQSAL